MKVFFKTRIDVGYDRSVLQNWGLGFGISGLGFGKKKGTLGQIGVWGLDSGLGLWSGI